jgi:putative phosphoribosyl transferase
MRDVFFRDRADAGRRLADRLQHLKGQQPVVLALPRGGVPVGFEIAKALAAPLDLLLVRKIGLPWHPELAVGAVVDGEAPRTVVNEDVARAYGVSRSEVETAAAHEIREIERRRELWLRGRAPTPVNGRTAIVVDDGIATGASVRVALRALADSGAVRVVLAAPVAPADTAADLRRECDETVFLATPEDFGAVGAYYADFRQLDDAEVTELLDRASRREPETAHAGGKPKDILPSGGAI